MTEVKVLLLPSWGSSQDWLSGDWEGDCNSGVDEDRSKPVPSSTGGQLSVLWRVEDFDWATGMLSDCSPGDDIEITSDEAFDDIGLVRPVHYKKCM